MLFEPNSFFIVLTNRCNLKCKHCYDFNSNNDMSSEILNLTVKYIIEKINSTNREEYLVNYVGGEIGLYNQDLILNSIKMIKESCLNKNIRFLYQSNLIFELTESHLNIIKEVDEIGTSYDYNIRFNNYSQYIQWIKNIRTIQNLNKNVRVVSTMTKQLTEEVPPQLLLELLVSLDIHYLEVNQCYSKIGENTVNSNVRPTNKVVREWYFELFKQYNRLKESYNISIANIDCLVDSYYGKEYWEYGRHCSLDNETITPNGNVSCCMLTQHKPMFNLKTGKIFNTKENIYNDELKLSDLCKSCKYLKYCRGGCQLTKFDETGCPVPYRILDYLMLKGD